MKNGRALGSCQLGKFVQPAEGPHPPAPCPRFAGEGENFSTRWDGPRREQPAPLPASPRSFLAERGEPSPCTEAGFVQPAEGPHPPAPCPRFAGEGVNCDGPTPVLIS